MTWRTLTGVKDGVAMVGAPNKDAVTIEQDSGQALLMDVANKDSLACTSELIETRHSINRT